MPDFLDQFATLGCPRGDGSGPDGLLDLRRAWAHAADRVSVEYVDKAGRPVPGQWHLEAARAEAVFVDLIRVVPEVQGVALVRRDDGSAVVLQPGGADRRLPGLAALARAARSTLLAHRPERRAVVRVDEGAGRRYVKLVRASKLERLVRAQGWAQGMPGRGFAVAPMLAVHEQAGRLEMGELAGRPLHELAAADPAAYVAGVRAAGVALRSIHTQSAAGLERHGPGTEADLLRDRLAWAKALSPGLYARALEAGSPVLARLTGVTPQFVPIHRDFHEKQVVVGEGGIGLLDFDTLAAGEAALDLGNMVAHLELRATGEQGAARGVGEAIDAFLDGYEPGAALLERAGVYADAARLRLALLFALWPACSALAPPLLDRIGTPVRRGTASGVTVPAEVEDAASPARGAAGAAPCPYMFLVGCPRSGTTLLERMLDARSDMAMAHETHWITRMVKGRRTPAAQPVTPAVLDDLYAERRFTRLGVERAALGDFLSRGPVTYGQFVTAVYELFRRRTGRALVGDKSTGGYIRHLDLLGRICPAARVVHLVRDGRDVCLSMLKWPKAARAAGRHPLWNEDPVATTAAWWRWHVRCGAEGGRKLGPGRYFEVRYEELVADPARVCAAICAFLGLAYDAAMPRFYEGRTNPAPGLSANAAWLPPTAGLRDWRTQLRDEHVEHFEAIAGDALLDLGYERRFPRVSAAAAERAARRIEQWEAGLDAKARAQTARVG